MTLILFVYVSDTAHVVPSYIAYGVGIVSLHSFLMKRLAMLGFDECGQVLTPFFICTNADFGGFISEITG